MRYAAKNRTYGNRVGVNPYSRFLVRYRTRYAMRKNESRHVHANANSDGEIQKLTSQVGVFREFRRH